MSTNEDLAQTNSVLSTDSPQDTQPADTGTNSNDVQPATNPEKVDSDTVTVQSTGEPITDAIVADPSSMTPYIFAGVILLVIIAGVVLIMRIKDYSGGSSAVALKPESDEPKSSTKKPAKTPSGKKASSKKRSKSSKKRR